jgi:hypothetical protein
MPEHSFRGRKPRRRIPRSEGGASEVQTGVDSGPLPSISVIPISFAITLARVSRRAHLRLTRTP